jgi:hypothetical protein
MSRKRQSHLWAPTPDRFNLAARKSAIVFHEGAAAVQVTAPSNSFYFTSSL